MTNLSQSDLDAIERIVEAKLRHYHLVQPIDTTEGEPIETEQRWKVNVERTYDHLNEYRIIVELDEKNGLNKERADKAAEAIKQYLSINQF
jgi:hypothetical protein